MSDSVNYSLFIIASWVLIVSPGPDVIYVITRGIVAALFTLSATITSAVFNFG